MTLCIVNNVKEQGKRSSRWRDMSKRRPKTDAQRATERRERKLLKLCNMMNYVEGGKGDHLFADAETKAFFLADLKQEAAAIISEEVDANPGVYERLPDGRIRVLRDDERKVLSILKK
jgi:hypothetical protein